MPTYEYICDPCEGAVELYAVNVDDRADQKCPECGEALGSPQISGGISVVFRGTGFHCNEYDSKGRSGGGDRYQRCVDQMPKVQVGDQEVTDMTNFSSALHE